MRTKFYLYASGTENDIRNLYEELKLPGSEMKQIKSNKKSVIQGVCEAQWMWQSPYQECLSNYPEDELEKFLDENPELLKRLKAHRGILQIIAVIVCQVEAGEQTHGYSISSNLIKLLSDTNASLEIDVVPLISR